MLSRVKLSTQAQAKVSQNAERAAERFTTKKLFRVKTRTVMNNTSIAEATICEYKSNTSAKKIEKRTIDGHMLHGSHPVMGLQPAHQFWVEQRSYQIPKFRRRLMPVWDRLAQSLIQITRPQKRALPELAFRSMAMFLKILTIVQVAETKSILMPGQMAMNVEGVVGEGKGEAEKKSEEKKDEKKEGENSTSESKKE